MTQPVGVLHTPGRSSGVLGRALRVHPTRRLGTMGEARFRSGLLGAGDLRCSRGGELRQLLLRRCETMHLAPSSRDWSSVVGCGGSFVSCASAHAHRLAPRLLSLMGLRRRSHDTSGISRCPVAPKRKEFYTPCNFLTKTPNVRGRLIPYFRGISDKKKKKEGEMSTFRQ